MGRDLSSGGMRVEQAPDLALGSRFRLAIYGPALQEPYLIDARVERDDGDDGLVLRFLDISDENARKLEKLVACLPDVESLAEGEMSGMGSVISEIISSSQFPWRFLGSQPIHLVDRTLGQILFSSLPLH